MRLTLDELRPLLDRLSPDDGNGLLSPEDVAPLEDKLTGLVANIPGWLLGLLREYGARQLLAEPEYFRQAPNPWGTGWIGFDGLLGYTTRPGNIVNVLLWHQDRLPVGLLPIAQDPGGNLLCYAVFGPLSGQVVFWDHEFRAASGLDLAAVTAVVSDRGMDPSTMDLHQLLRTFHHLRPDALRNDPGYACIYPVADGFVQFLESLRPTVTPPSAEALEEERAMLAKAEARLRRR